MNRCFSVTKDKKRYKYNILGIKITKKFSLNNTIYKSFINKEVKPNTILIVEYNEAHYETMTGLCKYCINLGFNVDIITRYDAELIFKNFSFPNVRVFECNEKTFEKILCNYDFSQYERIIFNSKRVYYMVHKNSKYNESDLWEVYDSLPRGQKENIYLQHHIDRYDDTPNDIQIVLANPAKRPDLDKFVVNCHYFKDTEIKDKNEVTNFISIGELTVERRNSSLLIDAVKTLHNDGITNFKVTIIGKGELEKLPKEIRQYFNILGRVDYQTMFNKIEKSDFILPLLDPESDAHKRYMDSGTSGTFQLVYGFYKPCIIHKIFADIYNFDENNSLIYMNNNLFPNILKDAINMDNERYLYMSNNLKALQKQIEQSSYNNFKAIMEL